MKYYVDLHLHTALSPCTDDDMTPNNIVNMSVLKGLDIIAVTDHNTAGNCEAVMKCGQRSGLLVVPGMELETQEEVHVLCLLPDIKQARLLAAYVNNAHPGGENREELLGRQLLFDDQDRITGHERRLLLTAVRLSLQETVRLVRALGGAVIPAHVDRTANSILTNLGFIPPDLEIYWLELSASCQVDKFRAEHPELNAYSLLQSSDAHRLPDILERTSCIELVEKSIPCLLAALRGG